MSVTVELSYDMSKAFGERRIALERPANVKAALAEVESRFNTAGADFKSLSRVTAIAINGVLVNHRRGMKTALVDGDVVAFVKAASGG